MNRGPADKHRDVKDEAAAERRALDSARQRRQQAAAAGIGGSASSLLLRRALGDDGCDLDSRADADEDDSSFGAMRARLRWDLPSRQLNVDVSQALEAPRAAGGGNNGATTTPPAPKPSSLLSRLGSGLEARYRGALNAGTGAYEYRGTLARHFDTPKAAAVVTSAGGGTPTPTPTTSQAILFPAGWGALLGLRDWRLSPGVSVTSCPARGPPAFAGGRANAYSARGAGGAGAAAAAAPFGAATDGGAGGGGGGGRLAYVLTARKLPQVVRRTRNTDVWLTGKVCGAVEPAAGRVSSSSPAGAGGLAAAAVAGPAAAPNPTSTSLDLPAALAGGVRLKAYRYGNKRDLRLSAGLDWAATGLRLRTGGGGGGAGGAAAGAGAGAAAADDDAADNAAATRALLLGGAADAALRPLGAGGAAADGGALEWALDAALSGGGGGGTGGGGGAAAAAAAATAHGGDERRRRSPGGALWRAWPYAKLSVDSWSVRLQRGRLAVLYEI
jgi:hypothetical protein